MPDADGRDPDVLRPGPPRPPSLRRYSRTPQTAPTATTATAATAATAATGGSSTELPMPEATRRSFTDSFGESGPADEPRVLVDLSSVPAPTDEGAENRVSEPTPDSTGPDPVPEHETVGAAAREPGSDGWRGRLKADDNFGRTALLIAGTAVLIMLVLIVVLLLTR